MLKASFQLYKVATATKMREPSSACYCLAEDTGIFGVYGESDEATLDGYLDELLFAACASKSRSSSWTVQANPKISNLAFSVTEEEALC